MGLLMDMAWAQAIFLVASGMLLYTAIVSPGYFVQQGQRIWLLIFGVLIVLDVASIVILLAD
jgi:hypothetical protein